MKQHLKTTLALMLLLITLSGCAKLTEREYSYTNAHTQGYIEQEDGDALIVENISGLTSAIIYYINEMADTGTIRLKNYPGNVEEEVASACLKVIKEEPIAAFCVGYITHEVSRIISYYELTLNFTYTRTKEEIDSLIPVYSLDSAKQELVKAYEACEETLLLRCYYYDNWADTLLPYINSLYYELPGSALLMPALSIQLYPNSGEQRIMEINFSYNTTPTIQKLRKEVLNSLAEDLVKTLGLDPDLDDTESITATLLSLYDWLAANVNYDYSSEERADLDESFVKNISFSAYGALYGGTATSEGFALTFKLICDMLGIDCQVVQGRRNGYTCCWNIVTIGENAYHVDPSAFTIGDAAAGFLRSDESFSNVYRWNLSNYPICTEDWLPPDIPVDGPADAENGGAGEGDGGDSQEENTPDDSAPPTDNGSDQND